MLYIIVADTLDRQMTALVVGDDETDAVEKFMQEAPALEFPIKINVTVVPPDRVQHMIQRLTERGEV